jgi:predicted nucleotidyltransferase
MSQRQIAPTPKKNGGNKASVDPLMRQITDAIRVRLPKATSIIFFGSRVAGTFDAFSDYDVLVLLPEGLEEDERKRVRNQVQATFPKIKLDLLFASERWLLGNLRVEADYRFWLENAIATYGHVPKVKRYPPLYKDALDSRLNIIQAEIKVIEAWSRHLHQKAQGYLGILKHLVLIEHALKKDYRNDSVWTEIAGLLEPDLILTLRDPCATRCVRRPMLSKVRRITLAKFREVRRRVLASRLPSKYRMVD